MTPDNDLPAIADGHLAGLAKWFFGNLPQDRCAKKSYRIARQV